MKLLVLFLFSFGYCTSDDKYSSRLAGGGNYGGFIGLQTYGAAPFIVKGNNYASDDNADIKPRGEDYGADEKNDRSNNDDVRPIIIKDDPKKNYGTSYKIGNIGYGPRQDDRQNYEDSYNKNDNYGYGPYEICGGFRRYRGDEKDRKQDQYTRSYSDDEMRENCDEIFGYTGPTANDEPENLIRPCALDDWQCIREYFAANGRCKPAYGPIPDPLRININTFYVPAINLTVTLTNLEVRGLSMAKITEFYVNRYSGNLVLAFNVPELNETSPRTYFRYRRTSKESIVLADVASTNVRGITFTAVIPKAPRLRLDLADIHADVRDGFPPFVLGPGAAASADPDVVTAVAQIPILLPFITREIALFQGQLFGAIYIQENICDFGLKLISV